jgi:hypothetical protein
MSFWSKTLIPRFSMSMHHHDHRQTGVHRGALLLPGSSGPPSFLNLSRLLENRLHVLPVVDVDLAVPRFLVILGNPRHRVVIEELHLDPKTRDPDGCDVGQCVGLETAAACCWPGETDPVFVIACNVASIVALMIAVVLSVFVPAAVVSVQPLDSACFESH